MKSLKNANRKKTHFIYLDLWLADGGAQSETSLASSSLAVHDGKKSELSSKILKADDVAHGHKSVLRGESGCNF